VASFGLDGVITGLGLAVFGADFAQLEAPQRLGAVQQLMTQYRVLLVWDNFELVKEMPDPAGATAPLDEAGCATLRGFLDWVREHSRSTMIITSRAAEDWLGQVRRIPVSGLNRAEAAEYAGQLLAPFPAARERQKRRSFGELLEWLDGHPLAMRLTLPRLDTTDPGDLLAALRGTTPLPAEGDPDAGRSTSLPVSITYSYVHLLRSGNLDGVVRLRKRVLCDCAPPRTGAQFGILGYWPRSLRRRAAVSSRLMAATAMARMSLARFMEKSTGATMASFPFEVLAADRHRLTRRACIWWQAAGCPAMSRAGGCACSGVLTSRNGSDGQDSRVHQENSGLGLMAKGEPAAGKEGAVGKGRPVDSSSWPSQGPGRRFAELLDRVRRENGMKSLRTVAAAMSLQSPSGPWRCNSRTSWGPA
jgi:hypothetical protein